MPFVLGGKRPQYIFCGQCTQRSACIHWAWRLPNTCPLCRFEGSSYLQPPRGRCRGILNLGSPPPRGRGRGILDLRPPPPRGLGRGILNLRPPQPGDEAEESSAYSHHHPEDEAEEFTANDQHHPEETDERKQKKTNGPFKLRSLKRMHKKLHV